MDDGDTATIVEATIAISTGRKALTIFRASKGDGPAASVADTNTGENGSYHRSTAFCVSRQWKTRFAGKRWHIRFNGDGSVRRICRME